MGGHGAGPDEPGRWIGPYRVVATLGEGGMGAVRLGRDARGRPAAVKVLRVELAQDEPLVRRFRRGADAASAVRGPGAAPVPGSDLDGPVPLVTGRGVLCLDLRPVAPGGAATPRPGPVRPRPRELPAPLAVVAPGRRPGPCPLT